MQDQGVQCLPQKERLSRVSFEPQYGEAWALTVFKPSDVIETLEVTAWPSLRKDHDRFTKVVGTLTHALYQSRKAVIIILAAIKSE